MTHIKREKSKPSGSPQVTGKLHVKLSPKSFYWGVLNASSLPRRKNSLKQLGYLFETYLPVPLEQVHAMYLKLPAASGSIVGGRWLACGMQIDELQLQIEKAGSLAMTLCPASLPSVVEQTIDPDRFNLLNGPFEPQRLRALRRYWAVELIVAFLICGVLLSVGLERGRLRYVNGGEALQAMRLSVYAKTLGPVDATENGSKRQPPELRLVAELRRLQQTPKPPPPPRGPPRNRSRHDAG